MSKKARTEAQRQAATEAHKTREIKEILAEAETRVREFFSEYDNKKDPPLVQKKKSS